MSSDIVRTRVAPSPTGDPHVGTAYQALFNLAFARSRGGAFVLRIEDTDQARSSAESEQAIYDSLRWLGLDWDEGPDKGGQHGPYRQSERVAIHREHAAKLLAAGHAYRCFCSRERLETMRGEQKARGLSGYDRRCRDLADDESRRRAEAGEPYVVRMKVPTDGACKFHDLLRGEVEREWSLTDDQVLLKSDGFPTYHLAVVVDDHLMGISHVIRGEEWLNSMPKHQLLYEYFGWEMPVHCHLPLLRNADKTKSKLSKRKNPTSLHYYRRAGLLPQAMVNFLAMMGWAHPDGEEKFSFAELVKRFRLEDVNLGGPVFDIDKLKWLNGRYIREDMTPAELLAELRRWALGDDHLLRIVPLTQPRLETLSDWGYMTAHFFADEVPLDLAELKLKGRSEQELAAILQMAIWQLEKLRRFDVDAVKALFYDLAEKLDVKMRDLGKPFYVALSGKPVSTPLFDTIAILGSDLTRVRLKRAIEALGGLSSKKLKAVTREYEGLFASVQG